MPLKHVFFVLAAAFLFQGCAHMLPTGSDITHSPWSSFGQAKAAFDKIEPERTTKKELPQLGFDPYTNPNMKLVTYVDLIKFFIPNASIKMADLAPNVRACIEARDRCTGYEISAAETYTKRYGSFLADFLQFKRHTRTWGWTFNALIVMQDGKVVYKLWSGQPDISKDQFRKKPLGLLQELNFAPSVSGVTF